MRILPILSSGFIPIRGTVFHQFQRILIIGLALFSVTPILPHDYRRTMILPESFDGLRIPSCRAGCRFPVDGIVSDKCFIVECPGRAVGQFVDTMANAFVIFLQIYGKYIKKVLQCHGFFI